ncbi:MAG: PAS domain S-box protein [Bacteroidales bacterium]
MNDILRIFTESDGWWETIFGPDGQILFVSKTCKNITGYSSDEFKTDPELMIRIIHPEDLPLVKNHLIQDPDQHTTNSIPEFRIITRSGESKWILHECIPVFGPDGKYLGKRAINREQTFEKRSLSSLSEKDNIISAINRNISDCVGESFLDSLVLLISQTFGADIVFIAETMILEGPVLRTISAVRNGIKVPGIEIEADKAILENVFMCREPRPFSIEYFVENDLFDLKPGVCYLTGIPLLDTRKNAIGMLAVVSAKTISNQGHIEETLRSFAHRAAAEMERTHAEKLIRESEEKYKLIIENQTDLVVKVDGNGRFLFVSPSYCETFGKKESELLGQSFLPLVHPEDLEQTSLAMESLYKFPYTCHVEQRAETIRGWRWFAWNDKALLDENNQIKEIIGIGHDITERKLSELELLQAKQRAEESDRLKTAFLANMSHEIRTPMNSILGFSGLLGRENIQPEKKKQYIEIIQNSTRQLLTVINDIIDIAKIEAGQINLSPEPVNLNKLCSQILVFYESERRIRNKTEVEITFIPGMDNRNADLITDGVRLQQILTNLLSNALKFTDSGYIRFGYRRQSNTTLLFYVEDTGKGVAEEKHQLIFQRFRQEEETFSRQYGGTGLGLSICKGLIDLFKGKIWVESTQGQGSVFYFTIPYQSTGTTMESSKEDQEVGYDWKDKTILIAEDTQSNLYFISELLADTGCRILHAENGAAALKLVKEYPAINLILMDIQMPVMNGYDATRAIRELDIKIPVIAQTAYAMSEDRSKCIAAGCNEYLAKPFDRQSFLSLLNRFLS